MVIASTLDVDHAEDSRTRISGQVYGPRGLMFLFALLAHQWANFVAHQDAILTYQRDRHMGQDDASRGLPESVERNSALSHSANSQLQEGKNYL